MILIGRESRLIPVHPLVGVHLLTDSLALGRWDLSYLTETGIAQYTNVIVHVLVAHSNQKEV